MPDENLLDPQQRLGKRNLLGDALKTFLFSLSQGMAASAQAPGRRGSRLGAAAALGAPFQLQQMEEQRQAEAEDRAMRMQQFRQQMATADQQKKMQLIQLLTGRQTTASGVTGQAPMIGSPDGMIPQQTPPSFQPGDDPRAFANRVIPQLSGPNQVPTFAPNPTIDVGGVGVTPPNAADVARMKEEERAATLKQFIAQARGQQQAERDFAPPAPPPAPFTLSPGQQRFGPNGQPIASVAPATPTGTPPRTVTTEQGVMQFNPATNKFDIRVGDRPKPAGNIFLNERRELELQNLRDSAPGQIIYAKSGLPVPATQVGDTASARISAFTTTLQQADVVKGLLDKLGDTGAIKGYVLREGVYWPVVQDNITPEQSEAVSEVQRLVNSYLYAVSGKQINEQEMVRIQKTAPDLRFTKEANQKITDHFRRYVTSEKDNYLRTRGWKIKEDVPTGKPTPTHRFNPATGKLEQIKP